MRQKRIEETTDLSEFDQLFYEVGNPLQSLLDPVERNRFDFESERRPSEYLDAAEIKILEAKP